MKVAIVGAGSIGLHLAGQLRLAGNDVFLICRTIDQVRQLQQAGLSYIDRMGQKQMLTVTAICEQEELPHVDVCLLTVKQTHVESVISFLKRCEQRIPRLIAFQNGVGHEEKLREALPLTNVYIAVTTEGAKRIDGKEVVHTGQGYTKIGPITQEDQLERAILNALFAGTQCLVQLEEDMRPYVWRKLVINSCINPLTALLGVHNGALADDENTLHVLKKLFEEATDVAIRKGIDIPEQFLQEIVQVCRNTYSNRSSMLQDVEAKRETEIDFINGAIVRAAEEVGSYTPYHDVMVRMVRAKQRLYV